MSTLKKNKLVMVSTWETGTVVRKCTTVYRLTRKDRAQGLRLQRAAVKAGLGVDAPSTPRLARALAKMRAWERKFDRGNGSLAHEVLTHGAVAVTETVWDKSPH